MKKTIVIVDDHVLIAKALQGIINNFEDFEVIYVCENGKDLIDRFVTGSKIPDILLLDISMPVMDGFETVTWVKINHPEIKVMALSMQDEDKSVIKMVTNGATGYLLKNAHPTELENALTKLAANGFFYPEWASKIIFFSLNKAKDTEIKISDREKEFLKYTVTELNYKEIADKMFCSPRTVESYRDNLCEKLELKTRVGLAVFAIKNGYA
ncbi:response regulator transcription factor [Pedobacter aquatilis]|uniref:response regulator transcription factor n=1 Tax=Pedobacter aquatilis TaxID=351343 RepID=UPI0025B496BE|nr:response regulator transcription factor [Pedobacter aquatilis]MDN3586443.1 response regulator transcription factor [Pedobacter aquatilis]